MSTSRFEPRSALGSRTVGIAAFGVLGAVFVVDVLTPQQLIVAIVLDVPIVMAALTRSRRLTAALVVTALCADSLAAFADAAHDGYVWDPIGAADRLLSMLSIVLVGFLTPPFRNGPNGSAASGRSTRARGARRTSPPPPTVCARRYRTTSSCVPSCAKRAARSTRNGRSGTPRGTTPWFSRPSPTATTSTS